MSGGGTPTAIPRQALEEILQRVNAAFPGAVELTVEAGRPDTIDLPMLRMLRRAGATRVCVNPQTFCDETLKRIGRRTPPARPAPPFTWRARPGLTTSTWI